MSNHDGSYMLNEVLQYLEDSRSSPLGKAFKKMSTVNRTHFFNDILNIGRNYDCNDGEIMSFIGYQYGFCYCCCEYKEPLKVEEDLSDEDEEDYICNECKLNVFC